MPRDNYITYTLSRLEQESLIESTSAALQGNNVVRDMYNSISTPGPQEQTPTEENTYEYIISEEAQRVLTHRNLSSLSALKRNSSKEVLNSRWFRQTLSYLSSYYPNKSTEELTQLYADAVSKALVDNNVTAIRYLAEYYGTPYTHDVVRHLKLINDCQSCGSSYIPEDPNGCTTINLATDYSSAGSPPVYSVCRSCLGTEYTQCLTCTYYYSHGAYPQCPNCHRVVRCNGCGCNVEETTCRNYFDYCSYCSSNLTYVPIRNYSFTPPETTFMGNDSKLYFGIEVEVESPLLEPQKCAALVTEDGDGFFYCKADSSIDCGLEIVSVPFTFKYFQDNPDKFNNIFRLRSYKCNSKNDTCGMHIHLSADAFTSLHLLKFMNLIYDNNNFTLAISQRTADQLSEWCSTNLGSKTAKQKEKLRRVKSLGMQDNVCRHTAINTSSETTVELRIFRGTLDPRTFRAHIEFADCAFWYTKNESMLKVSPEGFIKYARSNKHQYPNLVRRLKALEKKGKL